MNICGQPWRDAKAVVLFLGILCNLWYFVRLAKKSPEVGRRSRRQSLTGVGSGGDDSSERWIFVFVVVDGVAGTF